jgi:hypothetical protein
MCFEDSSNIRREDQLDRARALASERPVAASPVGGLLDIAESDVFPTEGYKDHQLEALGFKLGPAFTDDQLFRTCTLPAGWATDVPLVWLNYMIRDERGYGRVHVFYDRRANAIILPVPATKPQEDAWAAIAESIRHPGQDWLWTFDLAVNRREGDDYVYCWHGGYGPNAEGCNPYDDDGRRLEVQVAPDGRVVERRDFKVRPPITENSKRKAQ